MTNRTISRAVRAAAAWTAIAVTTAFASSCALEVDLLGFVASRSASPNARFEESRELPQPSMAPLDADFSFLVVSDTHVDDGVHGYLAGLADRVDDAAFAVFNGDLVQNGQPEDFIAFRTLAEGLGVPWFPAIGNHDLYQGGWPHARDTLGPSSYSVKLGSDARLIVVDSANATLGKKQYAWLEHELLTAAESFIVVSGHVQFFTNSYGETQQFTYPEESAALLSLFERAGVDLVFEGHSHRYDHKSINGVEYYVSPAFVDGSYGAGFFRVTVTGGVATVAVEEYGL